jgi:hypothetical protein
LAIKVNVPKGFVARYEWVDGDLIITIERLSKVVTIKGHALKSTKGGGYQRRFHSAVEGRLRGRASLGGKPVVVDIDDAGNATVADSGTGSTGPRKPTNG